ncbi:transposase InsO family protein [Frigoribacterium sp. CG_9.8]|nr:transposase InsO family protein [Frigoribacterium sp. CG_9.8]
MGITKSFQRKKTARNPGRFTVSAAALSYASPTDPIDAVRPSRATVSVKRMDVYWDPASELSQIRLNSDRGSQFRSNAFVRVLKNNGITESMGRVGACGDNAAMESFFALLQKNVLDRQRWSTREELRLAIVVWTEKTHHRKCRQRRLGKLTPIEFETINMVLNAA